MPSLPPSKVTLDDLLRLKRAERPPPEFWTRFEEELRVKQLAALVGRRPWWYGPSLRLRTAFARFGLPFGAATAAVLAALVYHADQPLALAPVAPPATVNLAQTAPTVPKPAADITPVLIPSAATRVAETPTPVEVAPVPMVTPEVTPPQVATTTTAPLPSSLPVTPWTKGIRSEDLATNLPSPTTLSSSDNLTSLVLPPNDGSMTAPTAAAGIFATTVTAAPVIASTTDSVAVPPNNFVLPAILGQTPLTAANWAEDSASHQLMMNNVALQVAAHHMVSFEGNNMTVKF